MAQKGQSAGRGQVADHSPYAHVSLCPLHAYPPLALLTTARGHLVALSTLQRGIIQLEAEKYHGYFTRSAPLLPATAPRELPRSPQSLPSHPLRQTSLLSVSRRPLP